MIQCTMQVCQKIKDSMERDNTLSQQLHSSDHAYLQIWKDLSEWAAAEKQIYGHATLSTPEPPATSPPPRYTLVDPSNLASTNVPLLEGTISKPKAETHRTVLQCTCKVKKTLEKPKPPQTEYFSKPGIVSKAFYHHTFRIPKCAKVLVVLIFLLTVSIIFGLWFTKRLSALLSPRPYTNSYEPVQNWWSKPRIGGRPPK